MLIRYESEISTIVPFCSISKHLLQSNTISYNCFPFCLYNYATESYASYEYNPLASVYQSILFEKGNKVLHYE